MYRTVAVLALAALATAVPSASAVLDREWTAALRAEHARRSARHAESMASAPAGKDEGPYPQRIDPDVVRSGETTMEIVDRG